MLLASASSSIVVYNHIGPDGNYLSDFSRDYFTRRYKNDWGEAINFETAAPARAFFVENATRSTSSVSALDNLDRSTGAFTTSRPNMSSPN